MARKGWAQLSDAYRKRLERGGISKAQYEAGESLSKARGHGKTPERPRGKIDAKKYPEYVSKRRELLRKVDERKREVFGDVNRWDAQRSALALRSNAPSNAELEKLLDMTDDEIYALVYDDPTTYKWLHYH
jgi:hypothetical protein